jgi:hypothetical protein
MVLLQGLVVLALVQEAFPFGATTFQPTYRPHNQLSRASYWPTVRTENYNILKLSLMLHMDFSSMEASKHVTMPNPMSSHVCKALHRPITPSRIHMWDDSFCCPHLTCSMPCRAACIHLFFPSHGNFVEPSKACFCNNRPSSSYVFAIKRGKSETTGGSKRACIHVADPEFPFIH